MKKLSLPLALYLFLFLFVVKANAVSAPSSTCLNPQGSVIAQYDSGTHGIVGKTDNFTGKDTVYKVTDTEVLQCFCGADGQGVQTNWVKASAYSDPEIQILKNQGWIYVVSGAAWGLDDVPYLAQNITYSCQGSVGGSNSSQGSSSNSSNGEIQAVKAVLGAATGTLAFTGNLPLIIGTLGVGILFLLIGIILRKSH